MEIELKEIRDFICGLPPFDRLEISQVEEFVPQVSIRYLRKGQALPPAEVHDNRLYIIRKGAVSLMSESGKLLGMLGEGDICTVFCMGDHDPEKFSVKVEEDLLVYTIPCDALRDKLVDHPDILSFIQTTASQRLKTAVADQQKKAALTSTLTNTAIEDILSPNILMVESGTSIRETALEMTNIGVSSALVSKDGIPSGIVTDKDLRKRCVAIGKDTEDPVDDIMTPDMLSIEPTASAFEALMMMTRKHIKHLPVLRGNEFLGIITATDLIRQEGRNTVYLASSIRKANSISELQELSSTVPELQLQLVNMGATAAHVGMGVTAVTTAITKRLLEMGQEQFGPPPVPFAWVCAGSQARREQSSHSDQDNGMIISDDMLPEHEPYFEQLAKFVCDGLNECGYIYCPGDVMAMNPKWRQTKSTWQGYFDKWVDTPEPQALMYSSIFFDLRTIYGDESFLDEIRANLLAKTQESTMFLAFLTKNAMGLKPPLGFFRDFVLVHDGEHDDTLDLKHSGIAPIVDLARIYALGEGVAPVNTIERIKACTGTPSLSEEAGANLLDAYEFITELRIEHQARQIKAGIKADNYMPPKDLSKLEREHLKDAFKVIQALQGAVSRKYHADRLG